MAPDSEARRQRIITHMNRDHKPELSRYLKHFASLSPAAASPTPELRDLSFERMLIRAGDGRDYSVPFTPPLTAWDEIRPRVVEMDSTARKALGEAETDDIVITEYTPPEGFGIFVFSAVSFYFLCRASLPWIVPGTRAYAVIEALYPGGIVWFRWIVKAIFWPVVLLHTGEAIGFDRTRMVKHGVRRGSLLWWSWVGNCWVEGYTAWKRVDGVIAKKRAEKGLKKD